MPRTVIEPFRVKSVEPIRLTTPEERARRLEEAKLNPFRLRAEDVLLDFLTDSGTGAMSARQWGGIMAGDESYAGAASFFRFEAAVRDLTGYPFVIPTHQGRAAERILFSVATKRGDVVPSNTHFDTTRANLEYGGVEPLDLVIPEGLEPRARHPFKGNIDLARVERLLAEQGGRVPFGMITVTNNSGGGQPVSLENLRAYRDLLRRHGKPLVVDACRFAENAMFVKLREPGQAARTPKAIAREMFSLADGCTMSAKKDGLANIGGFIALRDERWVEAARNLLVLTEGFPTYGGLAGRDLEAIAIGLEEVLEEDYLRYRLRTAEYLGEKLLAGGVAIVEPTGGHAVYLDARAFLPHLRREEYPGWALCDALYLAGGIRGVEIGSVMFGKRLDDGTETYHHHDLVRLAFPRRVYTQSHFDYAAEAILELAARAREVRGVRLVRQSRYLRHFTAELAWA
ncbi:tryptophanase [Anaeromyxobacter diazotrophicus]|uniref:Tryptophanase n=1 Tax=Anaeromyxobacter diazotrophicus TaxID=2590199 RepID=A0A7I9VRA5_9BACT|nr:tryptophanase [Anaeromyxobacter diazotrophicus]GEJ58962.1 tryptophanase [Anaeromyxobacter diazotrophicus]